jgi:spore maturation protein CgeB
MRLLLFDTTAYRPSSPLFLEAAEELAKRRPHEFAYSLCDEAQFSIRPSSILARVVARVARRAPVAVDNLNNGLMAQAREFRPHIILIGKGTFLRPSTLDRVKRETGAIFVNYATDDPFNPRVSTRDLVDSIPLYDLYACTKRAIMDDVTKAGCTNVIFVPFAYKPTANFPEPPISTEEHQRFDSDVAFIGGCDRDRIPFFAQLIRALPNLNLALYGGFWNRSLRLRRHWRGFVYGREFRMALGGTKIAINLVRRANRDGHVMRSFEIPACGAFMLNERTDEHLAYFAEGRETAYFASPEEMVAKVRYYLAHEHERQEIALAGRERVVRGSHTWSHRLETIIAYVREEYCSRSRLGRETVAKTHSNDC